MSNITLADYVGFIFSEITRARDHADKVAKDMAIAYSKDDVLKHFSVPRFKIPEMELTIPVLISSAKFSNSLVFNMPEEEFKKYASSKVNSAIQTILIRRSKMDSDPSAVNDEVFTKPVFYDTYESPPIYRPQQPATSRLSKGKKSATAVTAVAAEHPSLAKFYGMLKASNDPTHPENIAQLCLAELFSAKLQEYNLLQVYKTYYPQNELFVQMLNEVVVKIKENVVVAQSKMENLLVDPETNSVKNGSSDSTVFTIKAKIMEEGLFVKTITNSETGKEEQLVEFE